MTQVFIFGGSFPYGVGGQDGGWADMLKRHLHQLMYGENGIGEKHELYNFAKPGAPVEFVRKTAPAQLEQYRNPGKTIAILSVGLNNAKAVDKPDNFVSSVEAFQETMNAFLTDLKSSVDQVLVVGYVPHDETKTLPKLNPITGGRSYFWNARSKTFEEALRKLCDRMNIKFVDIKASKEEWTNNCIFPDGLHPNHEGHKIIFEAIISEIQL